MKFNPLMSKYKDEGLELKNLKVHNDMSQETVCFSASIYWKGKKIGVARNEGRGGCNFYDFDMDKPIKEFEEWVDSQHITYTGFDGEEKEVTTEKLDWIVDELREEAETAKWIKRQTKKQVIFRIEGDEEGSYRTVGNQGQPEKAAAWVREKYGDKIIEIHS